MSVELLQDLHLLTRDGPLNADARRKLKQIRHLVGLLRPAIDDALARHPEPVVVDCGAGKSYLGAMLYELVLGPAGRGTLTAIEARPELSDQAAKRAARFGQDRFRVATGAIGSFIAPTPAASEPGDETKANRPNVVTALHACDTATDDALVLAIAQAADHVAVVPCCQAEVARLLADAAVDDPAVRALYAHPWHRRELGSHLTNVIRALALEAHGYQVTVTELAGWEHALKTALLRGRRVGRSERAAQARLDELISRFKIRPALVRALDQLPRDPQAG